MATVNLIRFAMSAKVPATQRPVTHAPPAVVKAALAYHATSAIVPETSRVTNVAKVALVQRAVVRVKFPEGFIQSTSRIRIGNQSRDQPHVPVTETSSTGSRRPAVDAGHEADTLHASSAVAMSHQNDKLSGTCPRRELPFAVALAPSLPLAKGSVRSECPRAFL
jgi:hypothetical protein